MEKLKKTRVKMQIAAPPYTNFLVSAKRFHEKEKRFMVVLYNPTTKTRHCTSYARYLMAVHLGRMLSSNETVDHKNNDPVDDRIENLQILTRGQNTAKATKTRHPNGRATVSLICPVCELEFIRNRNRSREVIKNKKRDFCSKACAYAALRNKK